VFSKAATQGCSAPKENLPYGRPLQLSLWGLELKFRWLLRPMELYITQELK